MFKETFKYYKSKCPQPTYEDVIDFDEINDKVATVRSINIGSINIEKYQVRGLIPPKQWKIFEIKDRPGLIFILNPFTIRGQRYWISRCLKDYPKAPHIVNLNEKYYSKNVIDDWWESLQQMNVAKDKNEKHRLKNGMRWTTLGYHHDWDTKIYAEEKRNKFPDDLANLNEYFAIVLGFQNYSSEAAIINFYPLGTTLAGHTDHSEKNLNAPLFSTSFGQTAIFLLGGKTKEEKPSAIFLKSGDVVCMSKESRLCYHAVPRIMKTDIEWINVPLNDEELKTKIDACTENQMLKKRKLTNNEKYYSDQFDESVWDLTIDNALWKPFAEYISDCRINMNVRQVLENGEQTL